MRWVHSCVWTSLVCVGLASFDTDEAFAQRRGFGPNPDRAPSVFAYGFRGLLIGVPVGLSAGYLLTRDDEWASEDWKDLGIGVGVGAVGGTTLGMATGFYDLADRNPGVGMVVLRDTWYGTLLGASVGLIIGAVYWIDSGDAENVLVGGAWGTVIGAPVGTVVGFIEGPTVRDSAWVEPVPQVAFRLQAVRSRVRFDGASELTWVPSLSGSF